jgi:hypothetical protein
LFRAWSANSKKGETKTRRRWAAAMRVWRRQNQMKLDGMGCIESSPCLFLWPIWPALYIARSMPVFDTSLALIFKGFLLTESRENPSFRNSGMTPSDHPDGIRVIPETLYLRAFPRFLSDWNGVSKVTRSGQSDWSQNEKTHVSVGFL